MGQIPETEHAPAIKEFKRPGYTFRATISHDKILCKCSYFPAVGITGSYMTMADLREFLAKSLVRTGIDEEALENFAARARNNEEQIDVLLASGRPVVPGVNGWISYNVKASLESEHGNSDAHNVDFHNVQTFLNVSPGEEIGRIIPPDPGVVGKTLVGVPIRPIPGRAFKINIGKNIRTEEDGALLIATAAGRLCVAAGEISVEEEYSVTGNVDFKVGSIVFNGVVNVSGDVLDDFSITSTKGIKIGGNIGACAITCDGNIEILGIDGQNRGSIVCGGTLKAKFLHDCTVTCAGDVIVDVEMHNCTIKALGRIIVKEGGMSGGTYCALGGIETRTAGSPAYVRTKLIAGMDYKDIELLEQLQRELDAKNVQLEDEPPGEKNESLLASRADIVSRIKAIRFKFDERSNAKINVKRLLYENVLICLGSSKEEIRDQFKGLVSIIENTVEGGLRYVSITSLDVKAADIEHSFIVFNEQQPSYKVAGYDNAR